MIILLTFVAKVIAGELIANRALTASALHHADLDRTMLGQPGHLMTRLRTSPRLPVLHANLAKRPPVSPSLGSRFILRTHPFILRTQPYSIPENPTSWDSHRHELFCQAGPTQRFQEEEVEQSEAWDLVKFTEADAKKRAPDWAKKPGQSLEDLRKKWRNDDAPAGQEYAWKGTERLPATKNLSALLVLELFEADDMDKAVRRVISSLSDELLVILIHCIHELKQTYIRGRPEYGKAFRVDANLKSAAQYEKVLETWNAQRASPPSAATVRVANFIRDVTSGVARPKAKVYFDDYVSEALASGALEYNDLPTLRSLTATTLADIQAPPCTKYQSLRVALQKIEKLLAKQPASDA